jgi:hypothetical protein
MTIACSIPLFFNVRTFLCRYTVEQKMDNDKDETVEDVVADDDAASSDDGGVDEQKESRKRKKK